MYVLEDYTFCKSALVPLNILKIEGKYYESSGLELKHLLKLVHLTCQMVC